MEATEWDERYRSQELVWSVEPNRFVEEQTASLPPGRALDVAAGEGRNSIWLAGKGWRVTAVDFSAAGLEKGRRLAEQAGVSDRIDWVAQDLRSWSPEPGTFDLAVVAYLHLDAEALASIIDRTAAGLAPGGRLVVVGHDRANLTGGVGGPQDPAVLYSPDALLATLTSSGLVRARAATVERPTSNGRALDTLATASRPERSTTK